MKISIIHPSCSRPEMAYRTFLEWTANCDCPSNVQYIVSIDEGDPKSDMYFSIFDRTHADIWCNPNKSAIEAINVVAPSTNGDLLVVVSDDFSCLYGWDTVLKNALKDKSDFLVKTDDGIQPTLITLPIMDRVYYERFGYVYNPGYKHMWSDNEMTAVGHMLGKVIELPVLFKHNHYITGAMKKDAVNTKNDATWNQGEKLFNERKAMNFGLKDEEIVKPYLAIKWK